MNVNSLTELKKEYFAQEQCKQGLIISEEGNFVKQYFEMTGNVSECGLAATSGMILTRGHRHLLAIAGDNNALTRREVGAALFLHNHDGIAVIFTNFQLYALGFVHCTLNALACNITPNLRLDLIANAQAELASVAK